MPIIPTYTSDVTPTAETPNVLVNPETMSQGWKGLTNLSQTVEKVSDDYSAVRAANQEVQDKMAAYEAANNYHQAITERSISARQVEGNAVNDYSTLSGKEDDKGIDIFDGETRQIPELMEKFAGSLSPGARQIFLTRAASTNANYESELATHQATETRAYRARVVKDTIDIAKQSVLYNASDENIETQIKWVTEVVGTHAGRADKELLEKVRADLNGLARGKRTSNMVTTEVVAIQREFRTQFPDDPIRQLDEALTYATSPEWREDAMQRGIDEPTQKRIVSQLTSSLVQQKHLYDKNLDGKTEEFMTLLDGNGVDKTGRPLPGWKDKIDAFIYDSDSGLTAKDKLKLQHLANEHIDRQARDIRQQLADARKEKREEEHLTVERRGAAAAERAAANFERAERERRYDAAYYKWSSRPEEVAAMGELEFSQLRTEVGDKQFKHLQEERKKNTSPEALRDASIHASAINRTLESIPGLDDSAKAKYLTKLKTDISRKQVSKGKPLSSTEVQEAVIEGMQINLVEEKGLKGFFTGAKEKRKIEILKTDTPIIPQAYLDRINSVAAKRKKVLGPKEQYNIYQAMLKNEGKK